MTVPGWVESRRCATGPVQTLLLVGAKPLRCRSATIIIPSSPSSFRTPRACRALGSIELPWQPDQGELIVHKVQIVRGGTVIDLLANGQIHGPAGENNLESAVLDGMLTAVMQPEGLAVGDILDVAFTMRRHASALPLRGENDLHAGL